MHLRLDATTPNHYTTEAAYAILTKRLALFLFHETSAGKMIASALTELLTEKKQCKRIFHGNKWMTEHNYAFQNADTSPRLQNRTQNICFVISISAVILKRMSKSHKTLSLSSERCTLSPTELPRVFIWVVRGARHSGRSPSNGASISRTSPWSQPFPEYIYN